MLFHNDYDSRDTSEGFAILVVSILIITPFVPAGDIGLYILKSFIQTPQNWMYILSWLIPVILEYYLLREIYYYLEEYVHKSILIILLYVQSIFFCTMLVSLDMSTYSQIVVNFVKYIYKLLIST